MGFVRSAGSRFASVFQLPTVQRRWKQLLIAELAWKALSSVVFVPALGLLVHLTLWFAVYDVLTDFEIARFLLGPPGWICLFGLITLTLAIVALEQVAVQSLLAPASGERTALDALWLTIRRGRDVLGVTFRTTCPAIVASIPFLIAAWVTYRMFLSQFDINFYLSQRPPEFWTAAAIGVALATGLLAVEAWLLIRWSLAISVLLFEPVTRHEALTRSRELLHGRYSLVLARLAVWLALTWSLSTLVTTLVIGLGRIVIPGANASMAYLILVVATALVIWTAATACVAVAGSVLFSSLWYGVYTSLESAPRTDPFRGMQRRELPSWMPRQFPLRYATAVAAAAIAIASIQLLLAMAMIDVEHDVAVIAHRGASADAPENTLAAAREAIAQQADWIEIDVQETADGRVVVFHDSDFKKLAGVDLKIWNATMEDLKRIDIGRRFGESFVGEHVPTLREMLQLCRGKVQVIIELKDYGHGQRLARRMVDVVESLGMERQIAVMSLERSLVAEVRRLRPTWRTGLLLSAVAGNASTLDVDFLAANAGLATSSWVERTQAGGKMVYVWTVNDPATVSAMAGRNVDGIITDHPAMARDVLHRHAQLGLAARLLFQVAYWVGVEPELAPP